MELIIALALFIFFIWVGYCIEGTGSFLMAVWGFVLGLGMGTIAVIIYLGCSKLINQWLILHQIYFLVGGCTVVAAYIIYRLRNKANS